MTSHSPDCPSGGPPRNGEPCCYIEEVRRIKEAFNRVTTQVFDLDECKYHRFCLPAIEGKTLLLVRLSTDSCWYFSLNDAYFDDEEALVGRENVRILTSAMAELGVKMVCDTPVLWQLVAI